MPNGEHPVAANHISQPQPEDTTKVATEGGKDAETAERIKTLEGVVRDIRKDFLVVFGIFASIVTFLSVEVQVFKQAESMWQIIGISSFLLSAILSLLAALNFIGASSAEWKKFWTHPLVILAGIFFITSFVAFDLGGANLKSKRENRSPNKNFRS